MAEKTISKHLVNLENHFAITQPVLKTASKVFHELDQLEYDLGLLDEDESTACKSSWWPIISLIGGTSPVKSDFIDHYLGSKLHHSSVYTSHHKFTVLKYTPQVTEVTLPGSALDVDHNLPFYQITNKIEQSFKGEGGKINAHLELKTLNSDKLRGKLFIDTPPFAANSHPVQMLLMQHVLKMSDLTFIFTDVFDSEQTVISELVDELVSLQDTNNLIYIIDHSDISLDVGKNNEIINSWQQRLANLGLNTGHYIVLSDTDDSRLDGIRAIDERLSNVENDRSYRVLRSLEQNIRDIEEVLMPEVKNAILQWKERSNATTLIVMGFFISIMLFAEITMGGIVINSMLDPIMGPLILLSFMAFFVPLHSIISKVHAKFIITQLHKRQKELNLTENLAALFEKSLTFSRIMFPIKEPFGNNRKNRKKIKALIEKTKELVQSLNDAFSQIVEQPLYAETPPAPEVTEIPEVLYQPEPPTPIAKEKPKPAPFFPIKK